MKRTAATLALLALLAAISAPSAFAAPKAWTVLVYISGDNNLAEAGLKDINEMEKVGSSDSLDIVVQIDGSEQYTPDATTTRRYHIVKDDKPDAITSPVLADLGEADMGDPATLETFLAWGMDTFPARRYAVIVWNHGNGWYPDDNLHEDDETVGPVDPLKAISSDESSGHCISTTAIGDVMNRTADRLGRRIDLIGFDACLMGMAEVFYEIRRAGVVACGSEKTEPGDGWAYDEWLALLTANPGYDAEQLGRAIVETFAASYNGGAQGSANVTQAAVRLEGPALQNLEAALDLFADQLIPLVEGRREDIRSAVDKTQDFRVRSFFGSYFLTHKDLYDFALKIKETFADDANLGAAADLVMEAVAGPTGFVLANGITDVSPSGSVKNAHGVAVYLPVDGYEATYKDLGFARTGWFRFLEKLTGGVTVESPAGSKARALSKEYLFGNLHGGN